MKQYVNTYSARKWAKHEFLNIENFQYFEIRKFFSLKFQKTDFPKIKKNGSAHLHTVQKLCPWVQKSGSAHLGISHEMRAEKIC